MATKKEILASVLAVLAAHEANEQMTAEIKTLLEPKTGGKTVDLSEVTTVDKKGQVLTMEDSISGVWLEATLENFYEDKTGKGIVGTDGASLKRVSKIAYSLQTKAKKALAASKQGIFDDVLEGNLAPEDGKAKIAELTAAPVDYTSVVEFRDIPVDEPEAEEEVA